MAIKKTMFAALVLALTISSVAHAKQETEKPFEVEPDVVPKISEAMQISEACLKEEATGKSTFEDCVKRHGLTGG